MPYLRFCRPSSSAIRYARPSCIRRSTTVEAPFRGGQHQPRAVAAAVRACAGGVRTEPRARRRPGPETAICGDGRGVRQALEAAVAAEPRLLRPSVSTLRARRSATRIPSRSRTIALILVYNPNEAIALSNLRPISLSTATSRRRRRRSPTGVDVDQEQRVVSRYAGAIDMPERDAEAMMMIVVSSGGLQSWICCVLPRSSTPPRTDLPGAAAGIDAGAQGEAGSRDRRTSFALRQQLNVAK